MKYLLLIYDDETTWTKMSEEDSGKVFNAYMTFTNDIKASGKHQAGEALQPTSTATCVSKKGGKVITTDGPYAETKEQLGGFYLVDAKDLDEACQIAARIPSTDYGGVIEVRPVVDFTQQG
jgi:hypothetical protein